MLLILHASADDFPICPYSPGEGQLKVLESRGGVLRHER